MAKRKGPKLFRNVSRRAFNAFTFAPQAIGKLVQGKPKEITFASKSKSIKEQLKDASIGKATVVATAFGTKAAKSAIDKKRSSTEIMKSEKESQPSGGVFNSLMSKSNRKAKRKAVRELKNQYKKKNKKEKKAGGTQKTPPIRMGSTSQSTMPNWLPIAIAAIVGIFVFKK